MTEAPSSDTPAAPLRVYIVDDDEGVRHSLAALLLAGGHAAQAFASGPEFLAGADLAQPGCVLLDLRMDGMSGLQVFEAMRQQGTVLKTVFLSAHGELASAVAAVKQGAVDWLEKPCDEQTLLAAVLKAASLSQEAAQPAGHRPQQQGSGPRPGPARPGAPHRPAHRGHAPLGHLPQAGHPLLARTGHAGRRPGQDVISP